MGFKYPIKRPDSAKNNFSVFKIVNFKNTEICLNKFQTKIIFGNVLCKVHRTSLFHHKFFFMMKRLVKNLSFICRLCQARQMAETKDLMGYFKYPIKRLTAPKIILVFLKLSILKTLKFVWTNFRPKLFFGNVLCKVHRTSLFHHKFFFMMKRLVKS